MKTVVTFPGPLALRDRVAAIEALQRADTVLKALDTSRTSEDIERARKGVRHEVETALRALLTGGVKSEEL